MRSPVVEIDAGSGFCHGVVSAIRKAEEELARSGKLACLGDIVHNSDEVERLRQKGLDTITHDDLSRMSHCKYFCGLTVSPLRHIRQHASAISR